MGLGLGLGIRVGNRWVRVRGGVRLRKQVRSIVWVGLKNKFEKRNIIVQGYLPMVARGERLAVTLGLASKISSTLDNKPAASSLAPLVNS